MRVGSRCSDLLSILKKLFTLIVSFLAVSATFYIYTTL